MEKATVQNIFDIIKEIDLNINIDAIDNDKELNSQGVDSLDMMNIFFALEDMFSIKIDDESAQTENWSTVNGIVANINKFLSP